MPLVNLSAAEGNVNNTVNVLGTGFAANTTFYAQTMDGTANAGADYTAQARVAVTSDGTGNISVPVQFLGDVLFEPNEAFTLELYTLDVGGTVVGTATVTLTNDDAVPTVAIASTAASAVEGAAGPGGVNTFTVTQSAASNVTTTVPYTVTGTGIDGTDFVGGQLSGNVTITAGATTGTITLTIAGDRTIELDETFTITLGAPTNATIAAGGGTATGTITNDDLAGVFSVTGVALTESGGIQSVTVSRTGGTGDATVNYATASGLAIQGTDFVGASGTLSFTGGSTSHTVAVTILDDSIFEGNETFPISLSGASGSGTYGTQNATITITDNEPAPTVQLSLVSTSTVEGNVGAGGSSVFRATQSVVTTTNTTVTYTITGGGIDSADFATPLTGNIVIPAGSTTADLTVTLQGDYTIEANETYTVTLSAPINAALGVTTTQTSAITNDDSGGNFSITDVSLAEGNTGTTPFVFTVTRTGNFGAGVTLNYATTDGLALNGTDYQTTSGTLTFGGGVASQNFTVLVNGDTTTEGNENFFVTLSALSTGVLTTSQASGNILNDEGTPLFAVTAVTAAEGQSGTSPFVFTISRTGATDVTSTVNYATLNGTASGGADFAGVSGTLTFAPGQTSQTVTVLVNGDTIGESDETFTLQLSAPTNATFGGAAAIAGTGTITNDDAGFSVASVTVAEGNTGTSNATVTVTRPAGGDAASINYATSNGAPTSVATATAASDYTATSGTLNFAAGQTSATFTVAIAGDTTVEADEAFTVTLSGAGITTAVAYVTISNDDTQGGTVRTGSSGADTFVVSSPNDVIVEAVGGGNDAVFTQVSYVLPAAAEVETLVVQDASGTSAINLTGNQYTTTIAGSAGANIIQTGAANATMIGLGGDDTYVVSGAQQVIVERGGEGNDTAFIDIPNFLLPGGVSIETLVAYEAPAGTPGAPAAQPINVAGNELNQYIFGNSAANILSGNGGDDTLDGGAGDDTYRVFSTSTVLLETSGFDTVYASGTSYFLYSTAEIEYLSPAQQSATDPIYLVGNAASQVIIGNYGNNILNGRGGGNGNPDTLIGLFGDDVFGVFGQGDVVRETAGEGNDIVYANANYQLRNGTSIEALSAADQSLTSPIILIGNEVSQTIVGDNGANILDGRGGNDTLIGLGGADVFAFTTGGAGNLDTVQGFVSGTDRLGLASDVYAAVTTGGILAAEFVVGTAATTADQRLVYDQASGRLFYDADANGAGAAVQFAQFAVGTALVVGDFTVIAPVANIPAT